jgi:hypothetical protein
MTDPTDVRLRALYAAHAADAPDTPHPDPDDLADAALGRGSPASRLAAFDHALTCAACRRELDLLRTVAGAGRRTREQQSWTRVILAAAAMIVLAVGLSVAGRGLLTRPWRTPVTDEERGTTAEDAAAVVLVSPGSSVVAGSAPALVWRHVPEATSYTVEVVSDGGRVVTRLETRDTALAWPSLSPGQSYRWRVSARVSDGTVRRSPFTDLKVSSP